MRINMSTLMITPEGQITLDEDVLQHLGVQPGEQVVVNKLPNGRIEIKAGNTGSSISDAYGILAGKNKRSISLSMDQIKDIAAQGWAAKPSCPSTKKQ
jgi:aspartate 1-decarboxylase